MPNLDSSYHVGLGLESSDSQVASQAFVFVAWNSNEDKKVKTSTEIPLIGFILLLRRQPGVWQAA